MKGAIMNEEQKRQSLLSELSKIIRSTQYDLILRKISAIVELFMKAEGETQEILIQLFIENIGSNNLESTNYFVNAPLISEATYSRLKIKLGEETKIMFMELARTGNSSHVISKLLAKRLSKCNSHEERVIIFAILVENDLLPYNYVNIGLNLPATLQEEIFLAYTEEIDAIVSAALSDRIKFYSGVDQGHYILVKILNLEDKGFDMTLVRAMTMFWAIDCLKHKSAYKNKTFSDASSLSLFDIQLKKVIDVFENSDEDEGIFFAEC